MNGPYSTPLDLVDVVDDVEGASIIHAGSGVIFEARSAVLKLALTIERSTVELTICEATNQISSSDSPRGEERIATDLSDISNSQRTSSSSNLGGIRAHITIIRKHSPRIARAETSVRTLPPACRPITRTCWSARRHGVARTGPKREDEFSTTSA